MEPSPIMFPPKLASPWNVDTPVTKRFPIVAIPEILMLLTINVVIPELMLSVQDRLPSASVTRTFPSTGVDGRT